MSARPATSGRRCRPEVARVFSVVAELRRLSAEDHTLFHSANIDELMRPDAGADLATMLSESGLDPEMLAVLSPEEMLGLLTDAGIDVTALADTPIVGQIEDLIVR